MLNEKNILSGPIPDTTALYFVTEIKKKCRLLTSFVDTRERLENRQIELLTTTLTVASSFYPKTYPPPLPVV
jgi:hypothetical protein